MHVPNRRYRCPLGRPFPERPDPETINLEKAVALRANLATS